MNSPALEAPQLFFLASIVSQQDGGVISITSQRSSSAITNKFDPDDAILTKINNKDCLDELELILALIDNVPSGPLAGANTDHVTTFYSKELFGPDVRDGVTTLEIIAFDDPLRDDRLV